MNLNKKMRKLNDNLSSSSRSNSNKKIMIKTLNFDKLPKNFNSSNYNANAFLNMTKSKTHRSNNTHLPSSSSKIHSKPCLIKPISSRNKNTITLNLIPKTSNHISNSVNHHTMKQIRPISRNKIHTNLFSNGLYASYNNSSATYKSYKNSYKNYYNHNASLNNVNSFTKISISKSSSRNKNFSNTSTYSMMVNSKDSINITFNSLGKSGKKLYFGNNNSILKNSVGGGKVFNTTVKYNSMSFNKLGGKFKRKHLLKKEEENMILKEKLEKLRNIKFINNFIIVKIIKLWKKFWYKKKKENVINLIQNFLNQKIVADYQKKFIRRYNIINSCEIFYNFNNNDNVIEINDLNFENVLKSEYNIIEKTLNTIENYSLKNNKILTSVSFNSIYYLYKNLLEKSKKYIFKNEYIYNHNKNKLEIISKLNNQQVINLLNQIISYINKNNFKSSSSKNYIIQLNTFIQNFKDNDKKINPILNDYIQFYKENETKKNLEETYIYKNIQNDFSILKSSKYQNILYLISESIKEIREILDKNHQEKEENYILIYKIQGLKYNLLQNETQLNKIKDSQKNIVNDDNYKNIIDLMEKTKKDLENESNYILIKHPIEIIIKNINECEVNLNKIIPLIEIILIKYKIIYNTFEELSSSLLNYFENFGNKNLLKLIELYNEASMNIPYVNINLIHFRVLLSKFDNLINILKNYKDNKDNIFDIFNLLILYKEEMRKLYENYNKDNDFKKAYNDLLKSEKNLENLKDKLISISNNNNILPKPEILNGKNSEELYLKIISNKLKYEIKEESSELENILFKELQLKSNTNFSKEEENKFTKDIISYKKTKDKNELEKIQNEISKKFIDYNLKNKETISVFPYPKIYILPKEILEEINSYSKITINEIIKYYSQINSNQELIISNSHNKKLISGIKIISNCSEEEIFKLSNPIVIQPYSNNKDILNNINYLSIIYSNIENSITNSLTSQLLSSLSSFSKKSFHNWINSTYSQISICTLCLIFTNEISNLLSEQNKKSPLREFNLISQKYHQWLKEESNKINGNIIKVNIILTLLSQLNIVDFLSKNEISDINSFNWLKYIRHLWDKNKKDVIIECGGWANYQLKQLNPFHYRILLTPDTDKVFLFNSSCFREKSASIIKVINNRYSNNSYKEIFEEFCNLFWTNMIEINSITSNFNEIKNIFDICTVVKSWIYMDNLDYLNKNSNTNINNLVYLSKFMQTVQQEVILNDIKYNDGEKMFCLMSCIEIDNDVKLKEEYLKGSSRILNFVKPDINYYLLQCIKLINNFNNNNKKDCTKNLIPIINQNESKIRNSLTKFYFDYDFYNELIIKLIIKYITNSSEGNGNIQNILNDYITKFSKKFSLSKEKDNNIEKEICDYLDLEKVLYGYEHIFLFKFLLKESSNITIPIIILINGFGKHFIIEQFKNFYKFKYKSDFKNDNIIILYKKPEFEYFTITKEFNLPSPKNKKLLKFYLNNFFSKFSKINLSDEFRLTILEYIHKTIKFNSDKIQYHISVSNFNKWSNIFLDYINDNNINIGNDTIFNIITQSLFISFEYKKDMKNKLIENAKNIVNSSFIQNFIHQKEKYSYFDINKLSFQEFKNYIDYTNNYVKYLNDICGNEKDKIITFISEDFANTFNYENHYIENPIINDNLNDERIYKINHIKLFIGYNISDRNLIEINIQNETSKKFIKNIKESFNKDNFVYFISQLNNYNINIDELNYIYKIFNRNSNNIINYENIPDFQILLKKIYEYYPKEEYCIISDNKLIKYLCKYDLFPNSKITFSDNNKNSFYINMDSKEFCNQYIYQLLLKILKSKIIFRQLDDSQNQINISKEELMKIINMIYDYYKIESEFKFSEKYPSNSQNLSIYIKIFDLLQIENKIQNTSFCTILLINYIKNNQSNLNNKISYQSYSSLSEIFSNNPNKLKEITMVIDNTLTNYKNLISDQDEFINSKFFYIKFINNVKESKDILNEVLEEVHLSLSNHFLFSLLITFELMINSFEISHMEMNYILNFMKEYYIFPNENIIKFKYENNDFEKIKSNFYETNGKKLLNFYTITTKSINNSYLQILNKSLNKSNNKYFYTQNIKQINRDVDKLLYYMTFLPDQSSSIFKYLINKYLINMYNFGKYNVNSFLKKTLPKNTIIPITIKASPSINVTNFLCSLSAYYEINFFIVRNCEFFKYKEYQNFNFKYLVDSDLINLIKKGMNRGYWIFICDIVNILEFMKIVYEIYENLNKKIHNNFKLFFDQKLILSECKKYIEDMTLLLNIDNENVDDLEAAHDIWVNVLEEKILTDSIMNETQKDILEIIENTTPNEKTGMNDVTINNKSFNTNNSIVSIKSIYNSITTTLNNNFNNSNLSDWNFLKNI